MTHWTMKLSDEARDSLLERLTSFIEKNSDLTPCTHNHLALAWEGLLRIVESAQAEDEQPE